ncbi:MAG TPA: PAS domain S-box protein [Noviherbaspirillum sp.]
MLHGQSIDWIVHAASDAMLIADAQGKIVLANRPAEQMFGYPDGALIGQPVEVLLPRHLAGKHVALRESYAKQPHARQMGSGMELRGLHRSGHEFPVEVTLSPLKTDDGEAMVMATVHDITRRKEAEAALQESEARMRAIFDSAVDAIVIIDEAGLIDRFNPAAERLFGYAENEVQGRNVSMLMPSPYREMHDSYLDNYCRTGHKKIIGIGREVIGLRRDGTTFPMDLAVAEMRFANRRMFTGMVRDISERKRAEEALRQSQIELRKLSAHQERLKEEERKRIAQEIHDELGAQLTGIKAYVSVALDRAARAGQPADPLLVETAQLAGNAISTVRKVISDLRPSVLDQLGVWAALEWYAEQITTRAGLACICEIEPDAQEVVLDPERSTMVFRIVQEALTNVVRHAEAGRAVVRAQTEMSSKGKTVVVRVEDDGRGIDTEGLLNRESWGLLGMYERSRHHGGELRVTGTPGRGTSVVLTLPLEE